jgi:dihydroflavonol-4-reductase
MKKVFITGATGLVGSFLVKKFLDNGYSITALKREYSDISLVKEFLDQIFWIEGDVLDNESLEIGIKDAQIVIHAAAIVSFNPKDKERMFRTNVDGTANMVNMSIKLKTPRFCFISSIAALGRNEETNTIDEDTKWKESELNSNYSISKYQAELEVWRGIEEGLNAVIVNPSTVLGPGDWNRSSSTIFKYIFDGLPVYPRGSISIVDVRDVAELTYILIHNKTNERYILNNQSIGYKEFFRSIASKFNKRTPFIQATNVMNQIAWRVESVLNILFNHKPIVTKEIAKLSKLNAVYLNNKVIRETGFHFRDMEDSIEWCCSELLVKYL